MINDRAADLSTAQLQQLLASLPPTTADDRPGACNIKAMNARIARMEILYHLAGRHRPGSLMRGLFTGLAAADHPAPV